jgi:hypothetical protein
MGDLLNWVACLHPFKSDTPLTAERGVGLNAPDVPAVADSDPFRTSLLFSTGGRSADKEIRNRISLWSIWQTRCASIDGESDDSIYRALEMTIKGEAGNDEL